MLSIPHLGPTCSPRGELLTTQEQRGRPIRDGMKDLEPKTLVVVGVQPLEIKLPVALLRHLLRLEREGVVAIPAPDRQASTAIRTLIAYIVLILSSQ